MPSIHNERSVLSVEALSVDYAGRPTVQDVSLTVGRGEVVGLVGESGAGKSTILRSVVRLLPAQARIVSGRIVLSGDLDLTACDEHALAGIRGSRVATIFQNPGSYLDPSMRVGNQCVEVLRVHAGYTASRAREATVELFGRMGLPDPEEIVRAYPFELSGGMQQRVSIALAMAFEPELLLADEPTSALDTTTQLAIARELKALNRTRGTAILLVTHNIGLAYHLCDRIAVMQAGQIIETGSADDVIKDPQCSLTRELIAATPQVV